MYDISRPRVKTAGVNTDKFPHTHIQTERRMSLSFSPLLPASDGARHVPFMRRPQTHLSTTVAQQARVTISKKTTARLNEMHAMEQDNSEFRYIPHNMWGDTDRPGLLAPRYLRKYVNTNSVRRDQISWTCSTHGK